MLMSSGACDRPERPVLIPHTLACSRPRTRKRAHLANRQTIHLSIVKEQGGSRCAEAQTRTRQEKVMRAKREWSAGDF